jgi:hypothetical protein
MIHYLVEFIVSLPPIPDNTEMATVSNPSAEMSNSMSLLHNFLQTQYWGDLDINLSNIIEPLLTGEATDQKWVSSMVNAVQVIRVIADVKTDFLNNMPLLGKLLERAKKLDKFEIYACLLNESVA